MLKCMSIPFLKRYRYCRPYLRLRRRWIWSAWRLSAACRCNHPDGERIVVGTYVIIVLISLKSVRVGIRQSRYLPVVPRPVIFRRENGDGQSLIIRLVYPQDMLAGVRTQRAIRYGHHHDRKRIPEQAHRRGLAVRERTTQLIGRTLEGNPVRPRTI